MTHSHLAHHVARVLVAPNRLELEPRMRDDVLACAPMNERVLVTGAAGFIGAHVARHCGSLGMHVVGLDDLSGGFAENVPAEVEFVRGSVTDAALVARL